jgi:phage repressor protein C with HTH and peptisase S24 domain
MRKLDAAFPGWMDAQHPSEGVKLRGGVARILSEPPRDYLSLTWRELMTEPQLPEEFVVELPDDSMAPRAHKGDCVLFSTLERPRAGDGVLIRDRSGQIYFRLYRERRPGMWTADRVNTAYHPLDSAEDGLEVLAVSIGVPRQRWG